MESTAHQGPDVRRIERLAAEMALTFNRISPYQEGHPSLAGRVEAFHRNLAEILNEEPSGHLLLGVAKDKILIPEGITFGELKRFVYFLGTGTGYPKVRTRGPLHIASYMTQIADVYDALRSFRPYQPSIELERTLSIMGEGSGTEFEPGLFDNFVEILS